MLQLFSRGLMLVSAASAIAASLSLETYTAKTPKRLFIQHIIRASNTDQPYSVFAAASSDATPVDVVLTGLTLTPAEMNGREWLVSTLTCCCTCLRNTIFLVLRHQAKTIRIKVTILVAIVFRVIIQVMTFVSTVNVVRLLYLWLVSTVKLSSMRHCIHTRHSEHTTSSS